MNDMGKSRETRGLILFLIHSFIYKKNTWKAGAVAQG
jgi:hypothetical protein